jgi:TolB-like protein
MADRVEPETPLGPAKKVMAEVPRVFISYASQDKAVADAVCQALERARVTCWIAPRDVVPGDSYAGSIVNAIDGTKLIVLILSEHGAASQHVLREVERASSKRHPVIAFRIDAAPMPADLEYFLNMSQWLDASGMGVEHALPRLVDAVQRVIASPGHAGVLQGPTSSSSRETPISKSASRRPRLLVLALGVLVALGLASFAVDKLWLGKRSAIEQTPAAPSVLSDKSIAVLPFADMSEKHDQEYFADGIAEEVLDLLANIPGLKVIGRTSSFQFKGKNQDLRAIGSELGVNYVVEGSIRRSGERLRVTAQLINAHDGSHLWSDTYDAPAGDALKTQDAIAANLARALQVTVGADYRQTRPSFASVDAYDLYLRGRHASDRSDKEGLESAVAYFQQVLESDPTSVETLESLASAQLQNALLGYIESHEGFEEARRTARRVFQLDPNSSGAYVCLAIVLPCL